MLNCCSQYQTPYYYLTLTLTLPPNPNPDYSNNGSSTSSIHGRSSIYITRKSIDSSSGVGGSGLREHFTLLS